MVTQTITVENFGFPGGLSAESLVDFALKGYGVRLTVQEASELKKIWMSAFPEMQEFFKMQPDERETAYCVRRKAEELGLDIGDSPTKQALEEAMRVKLQGQVRTLRAAGRFAEADEEERRIKDVSRGMTMGVERYICKTFTGRVLKNKTYNACANAHFQGSCADAAKYALFSQWLRGYTVKAFVHDEVINELELTANLSDVAMEQAAAWVADAQTLFKHVRLKSEPALMLRWDKGAEACFDGEGRLQIWTPDIAVDEKKIEAIAETAWAREWRELFNSKGSRYGFQPLATAEKIMSMCNNQN